MCHKRTKGLGRCVFWWSCFNKYFLILGFVRPSDQRSSSSRGILSGGSPLLKFSDGMTSQEIDQTGWGQAMLQLIPRIACLLYAVYTVYTLPFTLCVCYSFLRIVVQVDFLAKGKLLNESIPPSPPPPPPPTLKGPSIKWTRDLTQSSLLQCNFSEEE